MRTMSGALIALFLAQPAAALTCIRPTVAASFGFAQDSPLTYVLATGRLTPLPGEATPVQRERPQVTEVHRVQFDGHFATPGGFDRQASVEIRVETSCAGPWCGAVPQGDLLLFLEKRGETYVLREGPCPRFALTATPETLSQAIDCLNGAGCTAP